MTSTQNEKVTISGNTYPVKDKLKAIGARWDKDGKTWIIDAAKLDAANAIVAAQPVAAPGTCSKCHGMCKAPYTLCWNCKPAPSRCRECGAAATRYLRIYRNGICSSCYQDEREEREMGY